MIRAVSFLDFGGSDSDMAKKPTNAMRVQYSRPQLRHFGELRQLTQAGSAGPSESANDPLCYTKLDHKPNANCVTPGG